MYGFSIGPKGRIVNVGGLDRTLGAAFKALEASPGEDHAHIYRQADGYRLVGYYTRNRKFIDMRVTRE